MKTNFPYGCKTLGEVRTRYDELSRVFNPTNSKEPNEMMNTINAEYDMAKCFRRRVTGNPLKKFIKIIFIPF